MQLIALEAAAPVTDLLLRLVLSVTVLRLELSFELLAVAVDLGQLIVSRFPHCSLALPVNCFQLPCTRSQLIGALVCHGSVYAEQTQPSLSCSRKYCGAITEALARGPIFQ